MSDEFAIEIAQLDQVKVYNHYLAFAGDVDRTAIAMSLDPDLISEMAKRFGWAQKVRALAKLPAAGSEESLAVNRTVNYHQARRLRDIVDSVAEELFGSDEKTLKTLTVPVRGGGYSLSAKPMVELVKSAEAVHAMTYRALGDGLNNDKGSGSDSDEAIKQLSVKIMEGLNKLVEKTESMKPADMVVDV